MIEDETDAAGSSRAIAQRLEALFSTVRSPSGEPYTDEAIAARAAARGFDLSRAYIQQLRRGRRQNPTVKALEALAAAFDVPLSYFFTDTSAEQARQDQALVAAVGDQAVRDIALRSAHLTDEGVRALTAVLHNLESQPGVVRYNHDTDDDDR